MATDYTPYVIIDDVTMSKVMERLNQGKAMAEKSYPHLTADFERVIKQVRERAECFTGSQNKPKTTKAYDHRRTEKVPFRETCHMAMEGEYTTTYMSKDGRLGFCDHVPRDKYGMVKKGGRAVRHFMIDGKVYKSKKKFLEAIKDFNP